MTKDSPNTTALERLNAYVDTIPTMVDTLDITTLSMTDSVFINVNGFSVHGLTVLPKPEGFIYAYIDGNLFKVIDGYWIYKISLPFEEFEEIHWFLTLESKDLDNYSKVILPYTSDEYLLKIGFNPDAEELAKTLETLTRLSDELIYCVGVSYTRRRSLRQLRIIADVLAKISVAVNTTLPTISTQASNLKGRIMVIYNEHKATAKSSEPTPKRVEKSKRAQDNGIVLTKVMFNNEVRFFVTEGNRSIMLAFNDIMANDVQSRHPLNFNYLSNRARHLFRGIRNHIDNNFDVERAELLINQRSVVNQGDFVYAIIKALEDVEGFKKLYI